MPRPSAWSACALLFATFLLASAAPAAAQSTLTGRVVDARTLAGVPGAVIRADGTPLGTATDADGQFSLVIPERVATVTVSALGYGRQSVAVTAAARGGEPLSVRLNEATADLQPVVVTAGRGERNRSDAPLAVAALSAADLRDTRPNLLAEALNRIPGVHMVDLGNEQHALAIRQPFSLKPLFLYLEDGVPIRPAGLFNHNALIEINQADLDAVEVVRGPGSALYGAGAIGGAVNFITARPTLGTEAAASVRHSGTGYTRADGRASGTLGRVGLAGGGYVSRQREGVRDHSDGDKVSASLRAETRLGAATTLAATATANVLDTDTDGALDSLNFFSGGTTSLQTFSYRRVEAVRAAVRLDRVWGTRGLTTATVFSRANRVAQNPAYRLRATGPTEAVGEVNAQRFRSLGLTLQHEVFPGWRGARIVAGATADVSPSGYTARFGTATRDAEGRFVDFAETDSLLTDYAVRLTTLAAFVQAEVEAMPGVRVVGSLRADRIGYALDNALAPGAFSGAADRTDTFSRVTPRVGVVVTLAPRVGLYANASQGFVPPEAGELYRGVQVPVLRPAVFTSTEAGGFASALAGRLAADVAVYRMDGRDEIVSVRAQDGTTSDRNAGRTRHEGVEVSLLAQPTPLLSARVGAAVARHTYLDFTVDERIGRERVFDGNRMEKAPALVANGEVAVRPLPGFRLAVEAQRVSGYWMDPENTRRYRGHTVVNARAGLTLRGVEVWANLLNATGVRYATTAEVAFGRPQYTPGLPRALTLGVGTRLGR
ncbi:MAG TPA: TonB-dependent receptor [Rubricoccaceae bacterium]